jgi:hypothetical protein
MCKQTERIRRQKNRMFVRVCGGRGQFKTHETDAEYLHCAGFFSEDDDDEEWIRCQEMPNVCTHSLSKLSEKGIYIWQVYIM